MEILKFVLINAIGPFVAGGGLVWVFHFRLRARRDGNTLRKEEFDAVSSIVERSTQQISELADKIAQIEVEKAELKRQILHLIDENKRLTKENQNMETRLKRYMSQK